MIDANDDAVLRFALATLAMKRRALDGCTASVPLARVNSEGIMFLTPSPNSPAATHRIARNVVPIHNAEEEWAEDDILTALHGCLQYLQDAREECEGGDREEEAARISELLDEFIGHAQSRERLLRTLVDALVVCEEGEEDSLLIECVSQGAVNSQRRNVLIWLSKRLIAS